MKQRFPSKKSCTVGIAALAAVMLLGCGQKNTEQLGTVHLKSQLLGAAGGEIVVLASNDARAAGAKITIPQGALTTDTLITLDRNDATIEPAKGKGIGPVIQFGPDHLQFLKPVTITLPYTGNPDPRRLKIYVKETGQPTTVLKAIDLKLDKTKKLLSFQANGFTQFQCGMDDPDPCSAMDCGAQLGLPNWTCEDGSRGGPTGNCIRNDDGTCGWEVNWCPAACGPMDCGLQPALAIMCPDGSASSAVCTRLQDGRCGWDFHCGECMNPPTPASGGTGGANGGGSGSGGTMCDPNTQMCPPACDPMTQMCPCDPSTGSNCPPPPPPVCHANCTDANRSCPMGTVCNAMTGDCVPSQTQCGSSVCGMGEVCCNASCGICAPLGGACPQIACTSCGGGNPMNPPVMCPPGTMCDANGMCVGSGQECGPNTCGSGEYCCNASCGICAAMGGSCPQIACAACGPNGATCPPDQQCNQMTQQCQPICGPNDCGPPLGLPNYTCEDGSTGGPTGRCILQPSAQPAMGGGTGGGTCDPNGNCMCNPMTQMCPNPPPAQTCSWEVRWCPRACDPSECGPQPANGMNPMCPNGTVTTSCQRNPDGTCSWTPQCGM